jgi:cytochrome c-type biogenesis protein CcmH/NrfG
VSDALQACLDTPGSSDALDCFQAYTRANPTDPLGFQEFGLFVLRQSNDAGGVPELEQAGEAFLKQALRLDPANVESRLYLAVLYNRLGRQDEADEQLAELDGVDIPPNLQPLLALARGGPPTTP